MPSLIAGIPMYVLQPLAAWAMVMTVYFIEAVAYNRFAGWYYRNGPAILRERWQTTAADDQIRTVIRPLLAAGEFVGRESSEGFHFRQRTVSINAWTRFALRIEPTESGAAVHYEARPFYSFAPLAPVIGWLAAAVFRMDNVTIYLTIATFAIVFIIYKWILPWDVSRMNRLPTVRRALSPYGLHVCEHCGYDLFSLTDTNRCPECGADSPQP